MVRRITSVGEFVIDEHMTEAALSGVDWNFPGRRTPSRIERIHPYPAKFIAEIPRALLGALSIPKGTAILDPFCGSGTTLVESQREGLQSFGIDLNPIACLLARVKTAPYPNGFREAALTVVDKARYTKDVEVPDLPNIDHWFDHSVQHGLATLVSAFDDVDSRYRDALHLALSSIVVRVSRQESDTRYAAINKCVTLNDVYIQFQRAAIQLERALNEREYLLKPAVVFTSDTLGFDASAIGARVGMVITSPPYPNAYEYWLYHKYRMYWLGFDPLTVKNQEIGARAHFYKRKHHTPQDFVLQMTKTFNLIRDVLVPGGYACFVVGRSRIHGEHVDNAHIVKEAASGFDLVFSTERVIPTHRKSFNLSHANIRTETLLVMKRKTGCF